MKLLILLCSLLFLSFASAQVYTVQSGDSLGKIAKKHGMTTAQLIQLNAIKDPNKLAVGQKLKVGRSSEVTTTTAKNTNTHKITSGDTFYKLAKQYGMSIGELTAANPGIDPGKLSIGQVINLKPSVSGTQPVAATTPPPQIQQAPKPQPAVQETPKPAPQTLAKVIITKPISLNNFAQTYNMSTDEVNKLNGWNYPTDTVFDTGSVAFIIKK